MTPAINLLKKAKANFKVHQYDHDPDSHSYGEEAVEKMGQDANQVFKTLLVKLDGRQLVVAVVPVAGMLDLKAMAAACGAKKAVMAEQQEAERSTGYLFGGISPLGQKKRLPTVVNRTADNFETIFISAGRRGLEVELAAEDLLKLTSGSFAAISK
ncbi:Cys-tRNA(Pro) deacylase [uncultured Endozoicomonas sp.]|uniref:Cys-tRNA(Pro) deacylase n=1 Tax=uncultured Endozoicomonas sp. TaxID=432652 RepID=UPI00261012BE|nr:Cys-tRNA(Pro) deacylase [uncultured Endozoicomonas sp.]